MYTDFIVYSLARYSGNGVTVLGKVTGKEPSRGVCVGGGKLYQRTVGDQVMTVEWWL